jgi:hypothetical protein
VNFKMVLGFQIIVYLLAVGSSLCVIFQFYIVHICAHLMTERLRLDIFGLFY